MVSIRRGVEQGRADLPNDDQIDELIGSVERAYPKLKPSADEPNHRTHFVAALRRLCFACRTGDRTNSDYGLLAFYDDCIAWLAKYEIGRTSPKARNTTPRQSRTAESAIGI